MQFGGTRKLDHGIHDPLVRGNGIGLGHGRSSSWDVGGFGWKRREQFRYPARSMRVGIDWRLFYDTRRATQIELENTGNHDDGLGPMSVLEHREPECLRAVDEQAAAKSLLVLNNPVAATVLADKEELRSR